MRTRFSLLALLAALLAATGCQKLNYSKTVSVPMAVVREGIIFSPPAYEQKVTVTIEPQSAAVSAYLIKSSNQEAVEKFLDTNKEVPADLLLGSKVSKGDNPETYSFEATVPAKIEYVLLLKGGKKSTEVKVKVVGR